MDRCAATQLENRAAESSVRPPFGAVVVLSGCCATGDLIGKVPTKGVARLVMDPARTELIMLRIDRFPDSYAERGGMGDPSSVPSPSPALCVPSAAGSNPVAAAKVRGLLEHERTSDMWLRTHLSTSLSFTLSRGTSAGCRGLVLACLGADPDGD